MKTKTVSKEDTMEAQWKTTKKMERKMVITSGLPGVSSACPSAPQSHSQPPGPDQLRHLDQEPEPTVWEPECDSA